MATVYLARDLKHNRSVALKVLKPELAAVVGAERFLGEIETTANLQHPHILPLFDSGEADSFLFYVMPFVDGETLRERIDRERQLPVAEAVRVATAVALALQHAHARGVIHRDIKPANILIQEGQPVVADFGIALAVGSAGGARLTETGLSVGTPFYMSPEQATGDRVVGPASDIYSLAAVLYEMLVGEPPYTGSTAQAVLGKILQGEPVAATQLRRTVPDHVDGALRKALEKLPADRFASAGDFAEALADESFRYGTEVHAVGGRAPAGVWKAAAVALGLLTVGLAGAWLAERTAAAPQPVGRFDITPPPGVALPSDIAGIEFDIAPDGQSVVYVGPGQLFVRRLDDLEPRPIARTAGADNPVFSPDGGSIAFWDATSLRTVSLGGGQLFTVLEEALGSRYLDWADDGYIYFTGRPPEYLVHRVPATGGEPEVVTQPVEGVERVVLPDALPAGRGLLATLRRTTVEEVTIGVFAPDGALVRELAGGVTGRYHPSGHLLYVTTDNALMAAPFDLAELDVSGPAITLLHGVRVRTPGLGAKYALSGSGSLVYRSGGLGTYQLTRVTRSGIASELDPEWTFAAVPTFASMALSPDDSRLAISLLRESGDGWDLWVKSLDRGPLSRLTFEGSENRRPSWTADGTSLVFAHVDEETEIRRVRADGTGSVTTLMSEDRQEDTLSRPLLEAQLSPEGRWFVYRQGSTTNRSNPDIFAAPVLDGEIGASRPLLTAPYTEWSPTLSPNGRWLAYNSNETGRQEVYVRPFPDVEEGRWQISTGGAVEPMWAHDGEEIFYRSLDGEFTSRTVSAGSTFSIGGEEALFRDDGFLYGAGHPLYAVAGDDQSFLMLRLADADRSALVLIQNFAEELRVRVPN